MKISLLQRIPSGTVEELRAGEGIIHSEVARIAQNVIVDVVTDAGRSASITYHRLDVDMPEFYMRQFLWVESAVEPNAPQQTNRFITCFLFMFPSESEIRFLQHFMALLLSFP